MYVLKSLLLLPALDVTPILFMITKEIKYHSSEYAESLELRSDILRVPLGKKLSDTDTAGEERQRHFGCFSDNQLKACVVAKPTKNESRVKLRQMAVAKSFQGKGIGKRLLLDFEVFLKESGITQIELSARETAIVFYEKLGYEIAGTPYPEQGIKHTVMQKTI